MNEERKTPANNLSGIRAVVVGAGSIGLRHRRVLTTLDAAVAAVSRRPDAGDYETVSHAIADFAPTYVVLATETERHLRSVEELISTGYSGRVLLEKPVLDQVTRRELQARHQLLGYSADGIRLRKWGARNMERTTPVRTTAATGGITKSRDVIDSDAVDLFSRLHHTVDNRRQDFELAHM